MPKLIHPAAIIDDGAQIGDQYLALVSYLFWARLEQTAHLDRMYLWVVMCASATMLKYRIM